MTSSISCTKYQCNANALLPSRYDVNSNEWDKYQIGGNRCDRRKAFFLEKAGLTRELVDKYHAGAEGMRNFENRREAATTVDLFHPRAIKITWGFAAGHHYCLATFPLFPSFSLNSLVDAAL
ncbi:hypothetical protein QAD02_019865 [Eretmocerus hayati]|uniref:Uncharacterized protein n=1 Tax=Eretmocerus hayati TaxID=131215 RepID=A0ACC2PLY6_9HYME|nr:hypothetical protein QAD02_019865 [Eretmocerus hayati]